MIEIKSFDLGLEMNHILYWIETDQMLKPKVRLFFTGLVCV